MDNPYTIADFERVQAAKAKFDELRKYIGKGEQCGVDCATARAILDELEAKVLAIERTWMSEPSQLKRE